MIELFAFLKTGIGKFLAGSVALLAAVVTALFVGRHQGATTQADKDVAARADDAAQAAKAAQDTYTAAAHAAAAVPSPAKPDPDQRDDFDHTF